MYQVGNLVKELSDKHGRARESLMPILQEIVQKHNYLTDEAMVEVAREFDIVSRGSLWDSILLYFSRHSGQRQVCY